MLSCWYSMSSKIWYMRTSLNSDHTPHTLCKPPQNCKQCPLILSLLLPLTWVWIQPTLSAVNIHRPHKNIPHSTTPDTPEPLYPELVPASLVSHRQWTCVRILVLLSIYMHILNFFYFYFSHLLFQTDVLLLFSSKDMSRNDMLKIISEYFLDKC